VNDAAVSAMAHWLTGGGQVEGVAAITTCSATGACDAEDARPHARAQRAAGRPRLRARCC
jgi:hypothetical protein